MNSSNSIVSIPDIVGVEITNYRPLSSLSIDSGEIVIDCSKFQCLPQVDDKVRGVVDSGCSVAESDEQQHQNLIKPKIGARLGSSKRLTRRATKTPTRLPRL